MALSEADKRWIESHGGTVGVVSEAEAARRETTPTTRTRTSSGDIFRGGAIVGGIPQMTQAELAYERALEAARQARQSATQTAVANIGGTIVGGGATAGDMSWWMPRYEEIRQRYGLPMPSSQEEWNQWMRDIMSSQAAWESLGGTPSTGTPTTGEMGEWSLEPPPFPTTNPPAGYHWEWDSSSMRYIAAPDSPSATMTEWQKWQAQQAEKEAALELEQWLWEKTMSEDEVERKAAQEQWERMFAEKQLEWEQQRYYAPQPISEYEQGLLEQRREELAWEQKRFEAEQAQAQQNYLAQLAAQPKSWLEYAGAAGQTAAIQPWMLPLMPQEYGWQAGQAIPGWTPENMTQMPGLTTPSAQYYARMGPTAQQQFLGYRQARTGAMPEETQFRLWSAAPPGGSNVGLQYRR